MDRVTFFIIANMFICLTIITAGLNPYVIMLWFWNLVYLFLGED